jgi:hypothetical protein
MAILQPAEPAAGFSISDAALEGFQAIGRHWRVVLGWALFNLLALIGGCILLVVLLVGAVSFGVPAEQASPMGALVLGAAELAVQVVIMGGLYRLELRPQEPAFLHLMIGRDELRVFAALLLVAVPAVLLGGLFLYLVDKVSPLLAILVGAALLIIISSRLALTPVIAFAEGRIDPVAAWRLTRGQTGRLLAMAALLFCLLAVIGVAVWIAVFLLGGALTGFQDLGLSDAETAALHPGRFLFVLATEMLLFPVFLVLSQAPWVAVYRALKP